jgi:hypothetical protein
MGYGLSNLGIQNKFDFINHEKCRGGIAALSFSAVGPIWLGRRLEQKTAHKACAVNTVIINTQQLVR